MFSNWRKMVKHVIPFLMAKTMEKYVKLILDSCDIVKNLKFLSMFRSRHETFAPTHDKFHQFTIGVTTLALGSWPRQGVARLQAKRKTRESHHMLLGMQRVWGNEPSHSQVNSHVGSWIRKWTPKYSERDFRGQNPSSQRVIYIIENLLKCRCLKWARIAHLDI